MNTPTVSNIRSNIMGTTSFQMKAKGMRKSQEFIVYPITRGSEYLKIQSDTRIAKVDCTTGKGLMSKPHSNGAYFHHLSMDPLTPFQFSDLDWQTLKMHIFTTAGTRVGDLGVTTDNSGAKDILNSSNHE